MPRILTEEDVARFRDRLCDIAEHLFAVHGAEAVTIRQLAGAMGVSAMTPYRYFEDRDAILAAVRARAFNRHADALEVARGTPGLGPWEIYRLIGEAYVRFALENPEAYKLMFDVHQANVDAYPELVEAMHRSRATMTTHLRTLKAEGLLRDDPDFVGRLFWAALHGPLMLQMAGFPEADAIALIEALASALAREYLEP